MAAGRTLMRRNLCSSSRLANLLSTTRVGHSIVWWAPSAKPFQADAAKSTGSHFLFPAKVDPDFFASIYPHRATTLVVSAQTVTRQLLEAWRATQLEEPNLKLVRRGTSLGSIDQDAAKNLQIQVVATPGVNSPHVAQFAVETLGLSDPAAANNPVKAVVVGTGSVGRFVIDKLQSVGVTPTVVNRSPESPSLATALRGATHVAVCAATTSEPIFTTAHVEALLAGEKRAISICSIARPEAFSLEAIMMIAETQNSRASHHQVSLRFDYGDSILAPTRDAVNQGGVKENVTWSSNAMSSEACKADMDEAVLRVLAA